jgi:hypothetical protein
MITLVCIPLVLLLARRLAFPVTVCGGVCFWKVDAAAIDIPAEERKDRKPRRKVEENSLAATVIEL